MILATIAFYLFATLLIASALAVIVARNLEMDAPYR